MKNAENIKLRDEWRNLNLKINLLIRTTTMNEKAGYNVSDEFKAYLKELIERRDYLTTVVI